MTTTARAERARVVVQQWVSLDGFAAGADGGDETDVIGTVDEGADLRSQRYNLRLLDDVDAVLLGGRTYRTFVQYWPTATDLIAERVNEIPKIIASKTLTSAPWGDHAPATVTRDAVDDVRRFRSRPAGTLVVWGSLAVTQTLLDAEQIDLLDLFVDPVWLGGGVPLLSPGTALALTQLVSEDWGTVTHVRYAVSR